MKLQIFSLRDSKSEQFGTPMFMVNRASAIRSVQIEVNKVEETNMLNRYPEDFVLFTLGEFDTVTGRFDAKDPDSVIRCEDLLSKSKST